MFLNIVLTECIEQIRAKALYATEDDIKEAIKNINHLKEIIEKLELN
mgnify:FL=1